MKKSIKITKLLSHYSRKIAHHHFVMGAMGNISVRDKGDVWIKRGGAWLERAKPRDFIRVRPKNRGIVSKEINLHMGCYKARSDINAVIHTHPFITTAMGTILAKKGQKKSKMGREEVAIIKYHEPGSMALATAIQKEIKTSDAVIMANHGLVAVGRNLKEAYQRTVQIEVHAGKVLKQAMIKAHSS